MFFHRLMKTIYFERVHKRKDGSEYHAGITSVKDKIRREYFMLLLEILLSKKEIEAKNS